MYAICEGNPSPSESEGDWRTVGWTSRWLILVSLLIVGSGAARTETSVWTTFGPDNRPIHSLAIDPQNPSTLYAATSQTVFKSTDEGASWSTADSGLPGTAGALVIDPQNPTTVYAVMGLAGVFKSMDGGASWDAVNSGLPPSWGIRTLAIDPQNPSTLYAGTDYGDDEGDPNTDIFKSTDGGTNWLRTQLNHGVEALVISPQGVIYAGGFAGKNYSDAGGIGGIAQSMDGGATWVDTLRGPGFVSSLAINPQDPKT